MIKITDVSMDSDSVNSQTRELTSSDAELELAQELFYGDLILQKDGGMLRVQSDLVIKVFSGDPTCLAKLHALVDMCTQARGVTFDSKGWAHLPKFN